MNQQIILDAFFVCVDQMQYAALAMHKRKVPTYLIVHASHPFLLDLIFLEQNKNRESQCYVIL